jgi:hypothetical protein
MWAKKETAMERDITLKDVLRIWQEQMARQDTRGTHLETSQIDELITRQLDPVEEKAALAHLVHCAECQAEWIERLRALTAADIADTIHLQAAASQGAVGSIELQSDRGKFTITMQPSSSPRTAVLITLSVRPEDHGRLEGLTIRLKKRDRERPFLQGQIVDGEVAEILEAPIAISDLDGAEVELVAEEEEIEEA